MENSLLQAVLNFLLYFSFALFLLIIFKYVYTWITPHDEWKLVKARNNAAARAFGGAIIGYCLALASALSQSVSFEDFVVWGIIAMLAQILAFHLARLFMPRISQRIEMGEVPAAILLAALSIAIGLLNAASMTY